MRGAKAWLIRSHGLVTLVVAIKLTEGPIPAIIERELSNNILHQLGSRTRQRTEQANSLLRHLPLITPTPRNLTGLCIMTLPHPWQP